MARRIAKKKEFFIVRGERYLYAVASTIGGAYGTKKYYPGLSQFDVHGPIIATDYNDVVRFCTKELGLKLDKRMADIYKDLKPARVAWSKEEEGA